LSNHAPQGIDDGLGANYVRIDAQTIPRAARRVYLSLKGNKQFDPRARVAVPFRISL